MRILFLKSMVFVMALSQALNFTCADDQKAKFDSVVANEVQKIKLKESIKKKIEKKVEAINKDLKLNEEDLADEEKNLVRMQTDLKSAMRAFIDSPLNDLFSSKEADEGNLTTALNQFLRIQQKLKDESLSDSEQKAIQPKIAALEKAIYELRTLEFNLINYKDQKNKLEQNKKAIDQIPSILDQDKDLEIKDDEKNKNEKNSDLAGLSQKVVDLYESIESVVNLDTENDFTILPTLLQIYSKNIKEMEGTKSEDAITVISQNLRNERDAFLEEQEEEAGIKFEDVRFGTQDAFIEIIQASQAYQKFFKDIDLEVAKIEGRKDIPQIIRAYKAVQLGLLGIKKMEDAREFVSPSGSNNQTTGVPSSSYYNTPRLNSILTTNSKDLKYMLKRRRKNLRIYYKYR